MLSADERARAARFRRARARARFAAARGQLRALLGSCLGLDPALLRLAASPAGKPYLDPVFHAERLEFGVSHADGLALFAVAVDRPVGVDIERVRSDLDVARVARRALPAPEQERLRELEPNARMAAFFAAWTRLEASLKARGAGLAGARRQPPAPGWGIRELNPAPGYVGAVAARGADWDAGIQELPPPGGSGRRAAERVGAAQAACE